MKTLKGSAVDTQKTPVALGAGKGVSAPTLIILILLFAAGALHWMLFFHYGHLTFKAHDWGKEYIYYSILRQALITGQVPYHISVAFLGTQRFLALPEIDLSPQILLLPLMDVGHFVLADVLILYTVGFAGCLLLRRRYGLSPLAFMVLFILYNFNGHITAHLGVGHSMWVAYFFLPFFFLLADDIVQGKASRTTPIKLGFVLFAVILQGGLHIYIWCVGFLVLLLIFNRKYLRPILWSILSGGALSAFRLIPAAWALAEKKEKFIWSYPTVRDLLDALITIRQQIPDRLKLWGTPGWWEHDAYIGVIGLALIAYFGIYLRFSRKPYLDRYKYREWDLPLLIMTVFSLSYFQAFFTRLPLPFLASERVATRFIIIPLVMLIFISSVRLESVLRSLASTIKLRVAAAAVLAVMALSFVDHSYIWSVVRLERISSNRAVDLTIPPVIRLNDPGYGAVLLTSGMVSAAAVIVLLYLTRRYRTARSRG